MAGHVDGVIMYSLHGDDPLPDQLRRKGFPVVVGGLPPRGARVSYVDNDNHGGAVLATQHLIAAGARVHRHDQRPARHDRRHRPPGGLPRSAPRRGPRSRRRLEVAGDFTQESGARAMAELLEREPAIDAVFAANDLMAAGALQVLQERGRRVPDDVALVGFDDSPIALTTRPQLTSVRQSLDAMGRELVTVLLANIETPDTVARKVVLTTELVVRGSSGGPPTSQA